MKKIFKATAFVVLAAVAMSGCIKEVEPQMGYADSNQVAGAPNAFDNYLSAVTRSICGKFYFGYDRPFDLGLPGMMLARDAMGQDMVIDNSEWHASCRGHITTHGSTTVTVYSRLRERRLRIPNCVPVLV